MAGKRSMNLLVCNKCGKSGETNDWPCKCHKGRWGIVDGQDCSIDHLADKMVEIEGLDVRVEIIKIDVESLRRINKEDRDRIVKSEDGMYLWGAKILMVDALQIWNEKRFRKKKTCIV
jgi:tRNA A37 N6-isopentenylltransferase MiaA